MLLVARRFASHLRNLKNRLYTLERVDIACLLPAVYFLFITRPYWGQTPALDAMYYYRQSTELFTHGLSFVITLNNTVHPPLFLYINALFFSLLGNSPQSYNIVGFTLLLGSSVLLYFFLKSLFGVWFGRIVTVLLFINPYVVSNFFYPNPDTMLLFLIIVALYAYTRGMSLLLGFICACLFLTKETGLVFAVSFTGLHIYRLVRYSGTSIFNKGTSTHVLKTLLPLIVVFLAWSIYSARFDGAWKSAYLFEETHESSYVIFTIKRILHLHFLNQYLMQNIFNIFALNFQWVYSVSLLLIWFFTTKSIHLLDKNQKQLSVAIVLTSSLYLLTVLSFPTWTIPRYGLVLLLCLFYFLTLLLQKIRMKALRNGLLIFFIGISSIANISSIDPLSNLLGTTYIAGEQLYNSGINTNGDDALTYNLQYMEAVTRQNNYIYEATKNGADVLVINCSEFKLWERVYSLNQYPFAYPQFPHTKPLDCLSPDEFSALVLEGNMAGKKAFLQTDTGEWITRLYEYQE